MQKLFNGIFLVPFFMLSWAAQAQVNSVSPYSKLGMGDFQPQNYTRALSMGSANLALRDPYNINYTNPASYTNLGLTTFEAGFEAIWVRQEQLNPDISIDNSNSGLRFFSFGVPLTDWWGSAIGLQPYTARGYQINTSRLGPDSIPVSDQFNGSGGINLFYWGNSFEVAEGLSLGVNANFLFGRLREDNLILWGSQINDILIEEEIAARGFRLNYGLQYAYALNEQSDLAVGITFSNSSKLSADVERYSILFNDNGVPLDSLVTSGKSTGHYVLPNEFGIGLSYTQKNNIALNPAWGLSADFEMYNGSEYRDPDGNKGLNNSFRAQIGSFMVPALSFENINRSGNYLGQVEYRLGGYYEQTPYTVNGQQLMDYGITFGLGLPVRQRGLAPGEVRRSEINTGVIFSRRGTLENGLIQESYLKFYLGITLNDKWFIDYKYR